MFLFQTAATTGQGGTGSMLIMLVLMFGALYFFMIRPENKKKKQLEEMRNAVSVGDNITTIGGIVGDICHVKDDVIVIEVGADRVRLEFNKWAISTNNTKLKEEEKKKLAEAKKFRKKQ